MRVSMPKESNGLFSNDINGHAPEIVNAGMQFSRETYKHTRLTLREFEGARARTADINGCLLCLNWRSDRDASAYLGGAENVATRGGPAPDEQFYAEVCSWRTSTLYSDRERLAIEYAERLGLDPKGIASDDEFWSRAKVVFDDAEIVDLSYCIACWMGLGRVMHALGLDGACALS